MAPWGQKSKTLLPLGAFSHVAVTYSDKHARIYINGTLEAEQKELQTERNTCSKASITPTWQNTIKDATNTLRGCVTQV